MIENRELKYAAFGVAIILVWFLYIKDLIAPFLSSQPPYIATLVYHAGIYMGVYLLSGLLVSNFNRIKFSAISISILMGLDIVDSPYILNSQGIFNTSIDYWYTTYDAAFGSLLSNLFSGHNLWLMVYVVIPILLIFIIPIWISNPKIIKNVLIGNG